jgi:hypothetical protein
MGEPILELQRSMVNILDRLGQKDRVNIIVFQSSFGMFESDLQNVTSENILMRNTWSISRHQGVVRTLKQNIWYEHLHTMSSEAKDNF